MYAKIFPEKKSSYWNTLNFPFVKWVFTSAKWQVDERRITFLNNITKKNSLSEELELEYRWAPVS